MLFGTPWLDHSFAAPPGQRYFDHCISGTIHELGRISVTQSEIIDFARQFDPQYFHTDLEKG